MVGHSSAKSRPLLSTKCSLQTLLSLFSGRFFRPILCKYAWSAVSCFSVTRQWKVKCLSLLMLLEQPGNVADMSTIAIHYSSWPVSRIYSNSNYTLWKFLLIRSNIWKINKVQRVSLEYQRCNQRWGQELENLLKEWETLKECSEDNINRYTSCRQVEWDHERKGGLERVMFFLANHFFCSWSSIFLGWSTMLSVNTM